MEVQAIMSIMSIPMWLNRFHINQHLRFLFSEARHCAFIHINTMLIIGIIMKPVSSEKV